MTTPSKVDTLDNNAEVVSSIYPQEVNADHDVVVAVAAAAGCGNDNIDGATDQRILSEATVNTGEGGFAIDNAKKVADTVGNQGSVFMHDEAQRGLGQNDDDDDDAHRRGEVLPAEDEKGDTPAVEVPKKYYYLDMETLRRLQRNDPEVDSLSINGDIDLDFPDDMDDREITNFMEAAGRAIGDSTVLLRLDFDDEYRSASGSWLREFGEGLSRNRSIEELKMNVQDIGSDYFCEKPDIFHIIAPFFEHNTKLRSIEIFYDLAVKDYIDSYVEAMAKCFCANNHLRRIAFGVYGYFLNAGLSEEEEEKFNSLAVDGMTYLMELLIQQKDLLELCTISEIGRLGILESANLLTHSEMKIQILTLYNIDFGNEGVAILGNALATNKTLKKMNIRFLNFELGVEGWRGFSDCLRSSRSALQELDLSEIRLGDEGAAILGAALATNKTLKKLKIGCSCSSDFVQLGVEGWRGFSDCLQSPLSVLEELELLNIGLGDVGTAAILGNALATNKTLKKLTIGYRYDDIGWRSFSDCFVPNIICDVTSIESTYSSNHTLCYVSNVASPYLTMNENGNKASVSRQKILKHHFTGRDEDILVFAQMPETVMPCAISWIGRDSLGYSLMLNFVRGNPTLFHLPNVHHQYAGVKRKQC
jgi:hypothetical protein